MFYKQGRKANLIRDLVKKISIDSQRSAIDLKEYENALKFTISQRKPNISEIFLYTFSK